IYECTKPGIGAFNGAAVGGGVTMTLPMDVRVASTNAKFGFLGARRGSTMQACPRWVLPRLAGPQEALEWAYSGRVFGAEEALKGGLIRSIHEPDELMPAAYALAREIADNTAPMSALLNRQMIWRMLGADHPMEAHKIDSRAIAFMGESEDAKEGVRSFLEKRAPEFKLRPSQNRQAYDPWWNERPFEWPAYPQPLQRRPDTLRDGAGAVAGALDEHVHEAPRRTGFGRPRLEYRQLVMHRAVAQLRYPHPHFNGIGAGDGREVVAAGADHEGYLITLMGIQTALGNQIAVHRTVEVGVVGDVVDMPVDVVVMPAGGDGVQVGVVGALGVGGHAEYLWLFWVVPWARWAGHRAEGGAPTDRGLCGSRASRRWPAKRSGKSTQYAWR